MKRLMKWLIDVLYTTLGSRWLLPSMVASISLVGFVSTVADPWCYFSGRIEGCKFALDNAWRYYPGKWAGLQFFGTGFLFAVALFSWPLLREQTLPHHSTWFVVALEFCFILGYLALLYGIGGDVYRQNPMLIERLAVSIGAPFVTLIAVAVWIIAIQAICIAINGLWRRALKEWAHFCSKLIA